MKSTLTSTANNITEQLLHKNTLGSNSYMSKLSQAWLELQQIYLANHGAEIQTYIYIERKSRVETYMRIYIELRKH